MQKLILSIYRALPLFKGKYRLGSIFFKSLLHKKDTLRFTAHRGLKYKIPNTLDNLGSELLINGIYEKSTVSFLRNHLKTGDIYFDVGANIGSLGMPVIQKKTEVRYVGFEASPDTFDYLKFNFEQNDMQDYELHNCVVHEANNQPIKFYQAEKYGESSSAPTFTKEHVIVNSLSLDNFCFEKNITHINLMKVDVQGFELFVFKGLQSLLRDKKVDNILFEFEHWAEELAGVEIGAAQQYLLDLDYQLYDINGKKLSDVIRFGETMIWAKPA